MKATRIISAFLSLLTVTAIIVPSATQANEKYTEGKYSENVAVTTSAIPRSCVAVSTGMNITAYKKVLFSTGRMLEDGSAETVEEEITISFEEKLPEGSIVYFRDSSAVAPGFANCVVYDQSNSSSPKILETLSFEQPEDPSFIIPKGVSKIHVLGEGTRKATLPSETSTGATLIFNENLLSATMKSNGRTIRSGDAVSKDVEIIFTSNTTESIKMSHIDYQGISSQGTPSASSVSPLYGSQGKLPFHYTVSKSSGTIKFYTEATESSSSGDTKSTEIIPKGTVINFDEDLLSATKANGEKIHSGDIIIGEEEITFNNNTDDDLRMGCIIYTIYAMGDLGVAVSSPIRYFMDSEGSLPFTYKTEYGSAELYFRAVKVNPSTEENSQEIPVIYDGNDVIVWEEGNIESSFPSGTKVKAGTVLNINAANKTGASISSHLKYNGIKINGTIISAEHDATYTVKDSDKEVKIVADYETEYDSPLVMFDDNIVITDKENNIISNNKRVPIGDTIKIVAKTSVDKQLSAIKVNGTVVSTENGFEYTIPQLEAGLVFISAEYVPNKIANNIEKKTYTELCTHDSPIVDVYCNSDQTDVFVDNKNVYSGTELNKASNGKVYFSLIEDDTHGKIKSVKYNGQKIKPRGYFFINVDEFSFDHIVIEVEYEN